MNTDKTIRLKYTILSVSLITVTAGAMIAPAVGSIATAFPGASPLQINVLTSLHAGMVVPFSFISGFLVRKFSKKNILIASLLLYLIGGIGGSISPSIEFMLMTRALLGISVGLMIPISLTLITDNYHDEERTQTLGLQSAATSLGGIIAILVSGYLATFGWQFSFMAYGKAGAILVSCIYLGQFISPLLLGSVSRIFGDGSVHFAYLNMAVALIFVASALLINRFTHFTGINRWLARSGSKEMFSEIMMQQKDMQRSISELSKQIERM